MVATKSSELRALFASLDRDADGRISAAELRGCMRATLGEDVPAEEADALVASADADGDGLLCEAEFLELAQQAAWASDAEEDDERRIRALVEKRALVTAGDMVMVSAHVGPHPVYDSDVEVVEPEMDTDYAILLDKLTKAEKEIDHLKEKLKRTEDEKMGLELHVADIVDDHRTKMAAMRLKLRKIRKYGIDKEAWYHYAVGSIVTLVAIMIAFVVALKYFR